MIPHAHYGHFLKTMRELVLDGTAGPWSGIIYRYVASRFAPAGRIMSGTGAFLAGGRWNAPRTFHAVYCASNPELANREYFAGYRAAGLPLHQAMPLAGKAVVADLVSVLDLRDTKIQARLGVSQEKLDRDNWKAATDAGQESLCQALGRAAHEAGVEGLLVRSAHARDPGDFNIVLIIENAPAGSGKWAVMRGGRGTGAK